MTEKNVISILNSIIKPGMDSYEVGVALNALDIDSRSYRIKSGATKNCILFKDYPYAIKWTNCGRYSRCDEAMDEVKIYNEAVERGLDKYFPETTLLATINGVNIVKQAKIDFNCEDTTGDFERKASRVTKTVKSSLINKVQKDFNKAANGRAERVSTTWAAMAISLYGKRSMKALCKFLIEYKINDLHIGNLGYLKNKPVILDFSGYHR